MMTPTSACNDLSNNLRQFGEHLAEIRVVLTEFGPASEDTALVDMLRDPLDELIGRQSEALEIAGKIRLGTESTGDSLHQLVLLHRKMIQMTQYYYANLWSHEIQTSLDQFGLEGGVESEKWVKIMLSDLKHGCMLTGNLQEGLLACWEAFVVQAEKVFISMQVARTTSNQVLDQ
jgi:hypothetical protein